CIARVDRSSPVSVTHQIATRPYGITPYGIATIAHDPGSDGDAQPPTSTAATEGPQTVSPSHSTRSSDLTSGSDVDVTAAAPGSPGRRSARSPAPITSRAGVPRPHRPCHGDRGSPGVSSPSQLDRKSTRLNSSHVKISYAVFCLKKKKKR